MCIGGVSGSLSYRQLAIADCLSILRCRCWIGPVALCYWFVASIVCELAITPHGFHFSRKLITSSGSGKRADSHSPFSCE